jgi:hypothetical protein
MCAQGGDPALSIRPIDATRLVQGLKVHGLCALPLAWHTTTWCRPILHRG